MGPAEHIRGQSLVCQFFAVNERIIPRKGIDKLRTGEIISCLHRNSMYIFNRRTISLTPYHVIKKGETQPE